MLDTHPLRVPRVEGLCLALWQCLLCMAAHESQ